MSNESSMSRAEKPDEFDVMKLFNEKLELLDDSVRARVLAWMFSKFGLPEVAVPRQRKSSEATSGRPDEDRHHNGGRPPKFSSFAELYDAANPQSQVDGALVGAYWLQVCEGADEIGSQALNNQLKNLGAGVGNITQALDRLRNAKPALVLQLKKAGKAKQSRKTYKLTVPGIKTVEAMTGFAEEANGLVSVHR